MPAITVKCHDGQHAGDPVTTSDTVNRPPGCTGRFRDGGYCECHCHGS